MENDYVPRLMDGEEKMENMCWMKSMVDNNHPK